jgi:hypothetical protein
MLDSTELKHLHCLGLEREIERDPYSLCVFLCVLRGRVG